MSQRKVVMDNEMENPDEPNDDWDSRHRDERPPTEKEFEDDEAALRDSMTGGQAEEDDDVMEIIATQSQPAPRGPIPNPTEDEPMDEEMREIADDDDAPQIQPAAPPVFRPVHFDLAGNLERTVQRRLKKNHEPVLEELPKWSLLAKILKEIEDTMARIKTSHAGMSISTNRSPG